MAGITAEALNHSDMHKSSASASQNSARQRLPVAAVALSLVVMFGFLVKGCF